MVLVVCPEFRVVARQRQDEAEVFVVRLSSQRLWDVGGEGVSVGVTAAAVAVF